MKYISLYFYYLKTNIRVLFEYKSDLIFTLFSIIVWTGAGLVNIGIIYTKIQAIKGWNLSEIGLLYGMWSLTFAIYNSFGNAVFDIENYIVTGTMDSILTKPLNPLFQLIAKKFNVMGIGFLAFGVATMIFFVQRVNIQWDIFKVSYLIIAAIAGGILIFSTYLILGSLAFWFLRSNLAIWIGFDMHKFAQYPMDIYARGIKFILVTIFPFAFTNYFPISFLLGKVDWKYGIISPFVCVLVLLIAVQIWKMGLKKYEGAGS